MALICLLLPTCLQGPWEYQPDDKPIFRGITVNAYIINGRPIEQVCFERLYNLDEKSTTAFPFYDSATIRITGDGGTGETTVVLTSQKGQPNCFEGPADFVGQSGKTYSLEAVIVWDSAGVRTRSVLRGTTTIPLIWDIDSTAKANALVLSGTVNSADSGLPSLFAGLPESITQALTELYLPEITSLLNDSTALSAYITANRTRIAKSIDSLLSSESQLVTYREGDTLRYLDGALNLTSHYFKARYSSDIAGVLISQKLFPTTINPANRFDGIAGNFRTLTPLDFYTPGTEQRIQALRQIKGSVNDTSYDLFDAIPVNNASMKGGKNTFYFYAAGEDYLDFIETYVLSHSDPNVIPKHSVSGGEGFFAGLNPDSFSLYVTLPPQVQAYTTFEARADFCSEEEWDTKDCRAFEPNYCLEALFNDMQYAFDHPDIVREPELRSDCLAEGVAYFLSQGKPITFLEDSLLVDGNKKVWQLRASDGSVTTESKTFTGAELSTAKEQGLLRFCFRTGFDDEKCIEIDSACFNGAAGNDLRESIFTMCDDINWDSETCERARILYCKEKSGAPEALCR